MTRPFATFSFEGVAKGSEKKGTTKNTKSTKKSFSFPSCSSWFKAFMLFATASFAGMTENELRKKEKKRTLRNLSTEQSGVLCLFWVSSFFHDEKQLSFILIRKTFAQ